MLAGSVSYAVEVNSRLHVSNWGIVSVAAGVSFSPYDIHKT